MRILALESSTSSAKALYYNTDCDTYEIISKPYTTKPFDDINVHNAEDVYLQMLHAGNELVGGRGADIIALSGTWHSIALFNTDMTSVTPVYQWNYTGASEICEDLRKDDTYVKDFYSRTGCMVNAIYPFFKLMLLSKSYDLGKYIIMGQGSYNNYRMTGRRVTTDCMLSGSGLFNIHSLKYDADLLYELGICEDQCSEIKTYRDAYPLSKEAASLLGVKSGIPVLLCNSDGALNQTGSGALADDIMTISVGTSGAIRLATSKPVLPDDCSTWCYRSPVSWISGAATNGCTNCIDWIKDCMFPENTDYLDIEKGIRDQNAAPVFLPFIFGERCPGWNDKRKGGFQNLLPHHTKYDLYLAVQEGVLFNLYQCYKALVSVNGEPEHIKISGGILHSSSWLQMCADIFKKTLEIDQTEQASLMGGVVLAKEHLGIIDDVRACISPPSGTVYPNPEKTEIYTRKFNNYMNCYYGNT